nr:glycoside hydrolase [Actinomycetota bacterium]
VLPSANASDPGGVGGTRTVVYQAGSRTTSSIGQGQGATYGVGHAASEPTIGIDKAGRIFYTATDFAVGNNDVLESSDHGHKWTTVSPTIGPVKDHVVSKDPYLYVDPTTQRVFDIDLTDACSYLSASDDAGKTWLSNPLACGAPINDHQTLFAGPPVSSPTVGYPNVVYYCYNNVISTSCSKSLNGGLSFSPTGSPAYQGVDPVQAGPTSLCGGLSGHGIVGRDGTVYLPRGWCGKAMIAISHDEGATWDRVKVSSIPSDDVQTSVAIDTEGNLYYVWVSDKGLPYLAVSRDGGRKWSRPVPVATPKVREANLVTIDAKAAGTVAIAYMGTENVTGPPDDRDHTYATWNGYVTTSRNALARRPTFTSTTINPPRDPLFRGTCGPGRCGAVWDFLDVVVGDDGYAYGAFVDVCTGRCATVGPPNAGNEGLLARVRV